MIICLIILPSYIYQRFDKYPVMSFQNVYYTSSGQLRIGVLSPTIDDNDNKCLVDVNGRPRLLECGYAGNKRMKLSWLFTQVCSLPTILFQSSSVCLHILQAFTEFFVRSLKPKMRAIMNST